MSRTRTLAALLVTVAVAALWWGTRDRGPTLEPPF